MAFARELKPADEGTLLPPMETLQILGGRKDKIRPGDVLGALTGDAGFDGKQIGKINVTSSRPTSRSSAASRATRCASSMPGRSRASASRCA
jgi:hypothetical protein